MSVRVAAISLGRLIFTVQAGKSINEDLTCMLLLRMQILTLVNFLNPDKGVPLLYLIAAEPALSIYCICMPAIFFLFRRAIRDGPGSIFSSSGASKARLTRSHQASANEGQHYSNDTEVELTRFSASD